MKRKSYNHRVGRVLHVEGPCIIRMDRNGKEKRVQIESSHSVKTKNEVDKKAK
jgi:hypothetical protein